MFFQGDFIVFAQSALLHHMPDGFVCVGWKNRFGLIGHFIIHKMGLMLDDFTTGQMGRAHHGLGHVQAAAVVDADLGNHQGCLVQSNVTLSDFHKCVGWVE